MKKKNPNNLTLKTYLLFAGLILIILSSCHVVVPSFAPANEFGHALSGNLDPEEPYAVGVCQCKTELYPNILFPTENASAAAGYLTTLNTAFPAWTFNNSATGLSDDAIEIKTYDAIGTSTRVGVWIHARYVPHGTDPTNNIHWVQILTTNHGMAGTGHGSTVSYVDAATGTTTPYYDEGYAADSRDFVDRPSRSDASLDHTWEATTFLVTGPNVGAGAGTVTLLGSGFTWGWKNTCVAVDGLMEYFYYIEKPQRVMVPEEPKPGSRFKLLGDNPENLILVKGKESTMVPVVSKDISFAIDKTVDTWGMVELKDAKGMLKFGEFEFDGKKMKSYTAEILSGSGFMNMKTGEASIEFIVPLLMPDGATKNMVFNGTGQYDMESKSFTIGTNLKGISETFLKANVPIDTMRNKDK